MWGKFIDLLTIQYYSWNCKTDQALSELVRAYHKPLVASNS